MTKPFLILIALGALTLSSRADATAPLHNSALSEILTPPAPPDPRLHGPTIYGVRAGSPFLYRIPCTGKRPIRFAASGLPSGLTLDSATGIIRGSIAASGTWQAALTAQNAHGHDTRRFRIVAGDRLALTPPMGWNSWYILWDQVSEDALKHAADIMIDSGMADFGYQYVNSDEGWNKHKGEPPYRDADGNLLPNSRFPDMAGMTDYIHAKGLKAGIYISPGPWTCGDYAGSYGHEAADAAQFAKWGFDFLKYDWCSYGSVAHGNSLDELKKPYLLMWKLVQAQKRDIVFNLCQYGMGQVWNWGAAAGNCWRTTGDLGNEANKELPGFYRIGFSNAEHWQFAHPGAWNDPDYLLIGWLRNGGPLAPTKLTGDEQYSYMSMWCLMAAPLFFSGDMTKLDPFTLNVLCNAEVIDFDQDALGKQARIVRHTAGEFVLVKNLEDGSKAVGLFNLKPATACMAVSWTDLGLNGKRLVRDVWRQKDIGIFGNEFTTPVHGHGVVLVRISPAR